MTITILMLAGLTLAGYRTARLASRAFAAGHLLVLRPDGRNAWLFERGGDGRYARLPVRQLPAALCRFVRGVPAVWKVRS